MKKDYIGVISLVLAVYVAVFGGNIWERITDHFAFGGSASPSAPPPASERPPASAPPLTPSGMVNIPAGEFWMGCNAPLDPNCASDEGFGRKVYVDTFQIDKTEVTIDDYKRCVDAGKCSEPSTTSATCSASYAGWNHWGKPGRGDHPVNCVSWHQADAYCKWAGKQLPTEAQWEKAARGTDGRKYPWAHQNALCDDAVMKEDGHTCETYPDTQPVGSKPGGASPYGALDMSGNVAEWTSDWYNSHHTTSADRNPTGPSAGTARAVRGGNFLSTSLGLRASRRDSNPPDLASYSLGLRCAIPPSL